VACGCSGAAWCKPCGDLCLLNNLAAGRRTALHTALLQLAVATLAGAAFLARGRREALAALAGAVVVALGTALFSFRFFSGLNGAGMALSRLLTGLILKWMVVIGGLLIIVAKMRLPPLPAITGLIAALTVYLFAFRFKG
jgi:ATP synthase protein I